MATVMARFRDIAFECRNLIVDTLGLILKSEVHSADIQDRDGAALVFDKLTTRFPFIEKICGDGGYQGPIAQKNTPQPLEIIKDLPRISSA